MKSAVMLVVWLVILGLYDEVLSEPVMENGMLNSNYMYMQLVCALVYVSSFTYTPCLACWICDTLITARKL